MWNHQYGDLFISMDGTALDRNNMLISNKSFAQKGKPKKTSSAKATKKGRK